MIVGAQKSGTTALASFLAQHPSIAMARGKEVHLFDADNYSNTWTNAEIDQQYSTFFDGWQARQLRGEATPIYLYDAKIAPELARYNSALKLIVILRDPVERALSHYEMERSRGNETLPLWLALVMERHRLKRESTRLGKSRRCHSYVDRGHYAGQVRNLRKHFPDGQILILETDELKHRHDATLTRVFEFLSVDTEVKIRPDAVFTGRYGSRFARIVHGLARLWLRHRFRTANRDLKTLLAQMNLHPDWHWLG